MPIFWLVGGCTLLKLMPRVFTFKFAKTDKNINSFPIYKIEAASYVGNLLNFMEDKQ
jgi:hypothetical protein